LGEFRTWPAGYYKRCTGWAARPRKTPQAGE
jgi:hypothetical protein